MAQQRRFARRPRRSELLCKRSEAGAGLPINTYQCVSADGKIHARDGKEAAPGQPEDGHRMCPRRE